MLRFTQLCTTASTGVSLSVAHGLGGIPNVVIVTPMNTALGVEVYCIGVDAVAVHVVNSLNTDAQAQVSCLIWQGRLY